MLGDVEEGARTASLEEPGGPEHRRERWTWLGVGLLVLGLGVSVTALVTVLLALDRPGEATVPEWRWWAVVGGGVLVAWSAPCFLRPRGRRVMAILLAVPTAAVVGAAWWFLGSA
jgi:hypothetical protein